MSNTVLRPRKLPSLSLLYTLVCGIFLLVACDIADETGTSAAVAMPDSYSADVADKIAQAGGNAVDMAIAAAFTLAVTYPEAGNLGGGGFMMIYVDDDAAFLDYREVAPLAATRDMYLDENGDVVPGKSLNGHLAVGVPGTVAGLWAAHRKYGTLSWESLIAPAIELAQDGFVVHEKLEAAYDSALDAFSQRTSFERYFSGLEAGTTFRQPELASTLQRIADLGPDGFYQGDTAALIVDEMARGGGLITLADLATYEAKWRVPLRWPWRDQEVLAAPLPSSGGIALIQLLGMKEHSSESFEGVDLNSAQYVHLNAEIMKRVFADRAEYLGDPDFVDPPVARLLDDGYLAKRAAEVNPDSISDPGSIGPGLESPATTHFSILDRWGNAVSNTYTLNGWFGSRVVVEGAGFLLNNEMDDFSAKPGATNNFGALGGDANAIEPGKRMLSSMSPTILLHDGEVSVVIGTPGGTTIFTGVFQAINDMFDFGSSPEEAASAPRFHHQPRPDALYTVYQTPSHPLDDDVITELTRMGYIVEDWEIGDMQIVSRQGGSVVVGSDDRMRGVGRVLE